MTETTDMAKKGGGASDKQVKTKGSARPRAVKLDLTMSKTAAQKLGRVSRWEKRSEDTVLELTGRV